MMIKVPPLHGEHGPDGRGQHRVGQPAIACRAVWAPAPSLPKAALHGGCATLLNNGAVGVQGGDSIAGHESLGLHIERGVDDGVRGHGAQERGGEGVNQAGLAPTAGSKGHEAGSGIGKVAQVVGVRVPLPRHNAIAGRGPWASQVVHAAVEQDHIRVPLLTRGGGEEGLQALIQVRGLLGSTITGVPGRVDDLGNVREVVCQGGGVPN